MKPSSALGASLTAVNPPQEALGQSEPFLDFQQQLSRVAPIDRPVLIMGERGTGKELVVSRLHYLSGRWQGPLVALNCAALAPSLLEAELFGHETGAFTGATQRRHGRFEAADEGTLFLDEIGLLPMEVQEKILRVVEYGSFERVGSTASVHVNVRIIGATNADLPKLAREGKFKVDLLDRLSFEVLYLPPLRERRGDIMLLARHFAARMALELNLQEAPAFSEAAVATLENYSWPGNVRELKNVVERAVYRSEGGRIDTIDFNPFQSPYAAPEPDAPAGQPEPTPEPDAGLDYLKGKSLPEAVNQLEWAVLRSALEKARYHQGAAARLMGVTYHQFRTYYRKYKDRL
jgi:psp operon transcriptional activator